MEQDYGKATQTAGSRTWQNCTPWRYLFLLSFAFLANVTGMIYAPIFSRRGTMTMKPDIDMLEECLRICVLATTRVLKYEGNLE